MECNESAGRAVAAASMDYRPDPTKQSFRFKSGISTYKPIVFKFKLWFLSYSFFLPFVILFFSDYLIYYHESIFSYKLYHFRQTLIIEATSESGFGRAALDDLRLSPIKCTGTKLIVNNVLN